jgi:hypothetical protein
VDLDPGEITNGEKTTERERESERARESKPRAGVGGDDNSWIRVLQMLPG